MREIRFRGKRVDSGDWVYGSYFIASGTSFIVPEYCPLSCMGLKQWLDGFFEVTPKTVGQFTGLLDKNKKEIYEGDLLKYYCPVLGELGVRGDYPIYHKRRVCFHEGSFRYVEGETSFAEGVSWVMDNSRTDNREIIGNIHENPELMEEAKCKMK